MKNINLKISLEMVMERESEREREKEFYDFGNQVACVLLFFDLLGAEHPYTILYFPFVLANCDLLHER